MNKLSVLIPVYNEKNTVLEIIRRVKATSFPLEIILVDDGSTDGTRDILKSLNDPDIKVILHAKNAGKGAALRTALGAFTGDVVIIQDADLEYSPTDYPQLLSPVLQDLADVVYGSRFLSGPHRVLLFWHYVGNVFFTFLANILYNINLSDMGTCYKVFTAPVARSLNLQSNRFGVEAEITAKVCLQKLRIYEVPISYFGRTYAQGKKITWKDGLHYFWALLRYRVWR